MYKKIISTVLAGVIITANGMYKNSESLKNITIQSMAAVIANNPESFLEQHKALQTIPLDIQKIITERFMQANAGICSFGMYEKEARARLLNKHDFIAQAVSADNHYKLEIQSSWVLGNHCIDATLYNKQTGENYALSVEEFFPIENASDNEYESENDDESDGEYSDDGSDGGSEPSDDESDDGSEDNNHITTSFSSDGSAFVIISNDRFGCWDSKQLEADEDYEPIIIPIAPEMQGIESALIRDIAKDGSWILTENRYLDDGNVYYWKLIRWDLVNKTYDQLGLDLLTGDYYMSPNHLHVAVPRQDNPPSARYSYIDLLDIATAQRLYSFEHNSMIDPLFSNDGLYLLTYCTDGNIKIYDTQTGALVREIVIDKNVQSAAFNADASFVAFCDKPTYQSSELFAPKDTCVDQVKIVDMSSGNTVHSLHHEGAVKCFFIPDGEYLVTYGFTSLTFAKARTHDLKVWNVRTGKCLYTLDLLQTFERPTPVNIDLSADGRQIFINDCDQNYVWDISLHQHLCALSLGQVALLALLYNYKQTHPTEPIAIDCLVSLFGIDKQDEDKIAIQEEAKTTIAEIVNTFDPILMQVIAQQYNFIIT